MDGAVHNRTFVHMHFDDHPKKHHYMSASLADPSRNMVFLMDPAVSLRNLICYQSLEISCGVKTFTLITA